MGCAEEGNFIQRKQLNGDTVQLWNSSVVLHLNYAIMKQHNFGTA